MTRATRPTAPEPAIPSPGSIDAASPRRETSTDRARAPSSGACSVDLYRGDDAVELLQDADLEAAWWQLAAAGPLSTRFQSRDFVLPWYRAYADRYEPLILLGHGPDRDLGALMALALDGDGELVHAGANSAWYHGWVAKPALEQAFLVAAVRLLFARLPIRRWSWRYLPPGAPRDWLQELETAGFGVDVRRFATPLWDLEDGELIDKRLHKGRTRNYVNRYRRQGQLRFESPREPAAVAAALDRLADWANLRLGALHGDLPYRDDPAKRELHRRAIEAGDSTVLHTLSLDDRLLAVHVGDLEGNRFFMGMQGHDPAESRQSPGTILLFRIAEELAGRGVRLIDFTPGGEPWKERYANASEEAFRIELVRPGLTRGMAIARATAVHVARTALSTLGIEPGDARAWAERMRARPGRALERLREIRRPDRRLRRLDAGAVDELIARAAEPDSPRPGTPDHDPVADLLVYERNHDREAAREFLSNALARLGRGWIPLTWRVDGRLAVLAWLSPPDARVAIPAAAADGEPRLLRGNAAPRDGENALPEATPLLWHTHACRGGDGEPLLDARTLLVAARRLYPGAESFAILTEPDLSPCWSGNDPDGADRPVEDGAGETTA